MPSGHNYPILFVIKGWNSLSSLMFCILKIWKPMFVCFSAPPIKSICLPGTVVCVYYVSAFLIPFQAEGCKSCVHFHEGMSCSLQKAAEGWILRKEESSSELLDCFCFLLFCFLTTVYCVCETEFSAYTFESRTMIKYLQVWHEK